MDFRDLTYLLAIARQQNITRAAESLYLSQPTLSKFLKGLEGELGLPLFERLGNKYIPTYAGEQYIKKAKESLALKKELDQQMGDIIKNNEGYLLASPQCGVRICFPARCLFFMISIPM